jgi:equilibrative nucleoside transporter 1/2/3
MEKFCVYYDEQLHSLYYCRGSLTTRIVWSILVEVVVFIVTVILAMSDSSQWPGTFFTITMITVVILNSK